MSMTTELAARTIAPRPDPARPRMAPDLLRDVLRIVDSPVSGPRFRALATPLLAELGRRADAHGTTVEAETLAAALTAAHMALSRGRDLAPRSHADWVRYYSTRIEAGICEDLMGPGWNRHADREAPMEAVPAAATADQGHGAMEAEQEFHAALETATDAAREYLEAWWALVVDEGWDQDAARLEAAARTGRTPNAARQLLHRWRQSNGGPSSRSV